MGTPDKLALIRDPFACKPAVVAETDDYVAIASEFRSLAHLPGIKRHRFRTRARDVRMERLTFDLATTRCASSTPSCTTTPGRQARHVTVLNPTAPTTSPSASTADAGGSGRPCRLLRRQDEQVGHRHHHRQRRHRRGREHDERQGT